MVTFFDDTRMLEQGLIFLWHRLSRLFSFMFFDCTISFINDSSTKMFVSVEKSTFTSIWRRLESVIGFLSQFSWNLWNLQEGKHLLFKFWWKSIKIEPERLTNFQPDVLEKKTSEFIFLLILSRTTWTFRNSKNYSPEDAAFNFLSPFSTRSNPLYRLPTFRKCKTYLNVNWINLPLKTIFLF